MKEFDGFWQQEKPENLLAYPSVREKFVKHTFTKWSTQLTSLRCCVVWINVLARSVTLCIWLTNTDNSQLQWTKYFWLVHCHFMVMIWKHSYYMTCFYDSIVISMLRVQFSKCAQVQVIQLHQKSHDILLCVFQNHDQLYMFSMIIRFVIPQSSS